MVMRIMRKDKYKVVLKQLTEAFQNGKKREQIIQFDFILEKTLQRLRDRIEMGIDIVETNIILNKELTPL